MFTSAVSTVSLMMFASICRFDFVCFFLNKSFNDSTSFATPITSFCDLDVAINLRRFATAGLRADNSAFKAGEASLIVTSSSRSNSSMLTTVLRANSFSLSSKCNFCTWFLIVTSSASCLSANVVGSIATMASLIAASCCSLCVSVFFNSPSMALFKLASSDKVRMVSLR